MASGPGREAGGNRADARRFGLLDGMVLIAALAACLVVPGTFRALISPKTYPKYDVRQYAQIIGATWLMASSVALAVLAVAVPKPAGRERFRQPGALAMILVALTWAYDAIQTAIQGVMHLVTTGETFSDGAFWWLFGPIYDASFRAGLAVLAGWITLGLLGLRSPGANWLDRAGRVLGWIWVAWGILAWVLICQTLVRHNTALNF